MLRCVLALLLTALPLAAAEDISVQMKRILQAYAILEDNAADPVSSEQSFFEGAIPGLLRGLDPHSVFFTPDQYEQLKKMESSTQKGFGTIVSLLPGRVIVLQTMPGAPSAKAGLLPGDEIVAVNGYQISLLDLDQLGELLGQSRQHEAELLVRRPGAAGILQFRLVPEDVQSSSVERAFFVAAGIGYIRVSSFDENTGPELKKAIDKLGGNSLLGLILDLRNNPGGLVTAALDTASLFLKPGARIVTVRGRNVPETSESVPAEAKPYNFKMAILINEKSASASEIVSGAMQDHDRATIIGDASFGKGLVQSVFSMRENTGLALTTALYYTPSGRSIQRPLASHFELSGATANPNGKKEFRTDAGRIVKGGGGIQPDITPPPPTYTRLRAVLDASGSFTNFATEYLQKHKVTQDFDVTPEVLSDFQIFLAARRIQPSVADFSRDREFIMIRLKTEIFNQAFGVEKGDEVDAERDTGIQKAIEVIGG